MYGINLGNKLINTSYKYRHEMSRIHQLEYYLSIVIFVDANCQQVLLFITTIIESQNFYFMETKKKSYGMSEQFTRSLNIISCEPSTIVTHQHSNSQTIWFLSLNIYKLNNILK